MDVYQSEGTAQTLAQTEDATARLLVGSKICVWNRFFERWSGGFEVVQVLAQGCRIKRLSDGLTFPDVFVFEDIRHDRRSAVRGSHLDRRI